MREIFISYRRDDSGGYATSLFKDLTDAFGDDAVFMDVVGIAPGRDFRTVIDANTGSCRVLLALIGKDWLGAHDESGQRRLDSPMDFVRLETASALKRDIPVVPVLLQGAHMPRPEQLPDDLKDLAYRNGIELTHARWDSDVKVLIDALKPLVKPAIEPPAPKPQAPDPRPNKWWPAGIAAAAIAVGVGMYIARKPPALFVPTQPTQAEPARPDPTPQTGQAQAQARPCVNGYVWREARPGDVVCVTPDVRKLTAEENVLAASRRAPGGGSHGAPTCLQGFVWREATQGDVVCVTVESRSRAQLDNAHAAERSVAAP